MRLHRRYFTREFGISSVGFAPTVATAADLSSVHGNDEEENLDAFKRDVINHHASIARNAAAGLLLFW